MKKFRGDHSGFTLIELMIVIAIIGVLAAIALPQYMRFSTKAKRAEGINILRGLHTTELSYYASEDTFPQEGPISGDFPSRLGYDHGEFKFYDKNASYPAYFPEAGDDNPGKGYSALMIGNLDGDIAIDALCISYPIPDKCSVTFCPGLPSCINAQPGQIIVVNDDVILE